MAPPAAVVVQVPAVADPADLPVLALAQVVAHRVRLPLVALLLWLLGKAVLVARSVVVVLVLVVEPAVPVEQLRSSRSSLAAMARNIT